MVGNGAWHTTLVWAAGDGSQQADACLAADVMALCPTALLDQPLQLTEPSPELLSLSPGLNQGKQASFDGWLALLVAPRVRGGGGGVTRWGEWELSSGVSW